jgi:hypothetical protein
MDSDEIRRLYYVLVSDTRGEKRLDAEQKLSADGGRECAVLAKAGRIISLVVCGNDPAGELDKAIGELGTLPPTFFWSKFMEISGQVLVAAGAEPSGKWGKQESGAIVEAGLKMFARTQSMGIPISEFSMRQVRQSMDGGGGVFGMAETIIKQNEQLLPERARMPRFPKEKTPAKPENTLKDRSGQG